MTEETRCAYTPQVGDTVRHPRWTSGTVEVLHVGETHFFGRVAEGEDVGQEGCWALDYAPCGFEPWVKVEPTPADRWALFLADGTYHSTLPTAEAAEAFARNALFASGWRVARFSFAGWED